jgi:hypothetical protein
MRAVLLIDFGSTYTKLTAVDLDTAQVLATADDFTTASTDVMIGFEKALKELQEKTGDITYEKRLACSSAAGGLQMIACGLVPALTAKAAKLAAFGAGAKVIKTYAYELTKSDVDEIDQKNPDILLLTGGTDGGNREVIEHNARMLATAKRAFPVVYAGNRASVDVCRDILHSDLHPVFTTDNVMPVLNKLNILPAQAVIRKIFLEKIISGKGLSQEKGLIDLGGATTDIYSIAKGLPNNASTVLHGLREPYAKRTVEGDIGMRYSAKGIIEAAGMEEVARISGLSETTISEFLARIEEDKSIIPQTKEEIAMDYALAALAVRTGLTRHAGVLEQVYTPVGPAYQQVGKDLTEVSSIIVTGGALIHSPDYQEIVREAVNVPDEQILIPRKAEVTKDKQYILSAMGLLATYHQDTALKILINEFGKDGVYAAS